MINENSFNVDSSSSDEEVFEEKALKGSAVVRFETTSNEIVHFFFFDHAYSRFLSGRT